MTRDINDAEVAELRALLERCGVAQVLDGLSAACHQIGDALDNEIPAAGLGWHRNATIIRMFLPRLWR